MIENRVFWSVLPSQTKSPYIGSIAETLRARGWTVERLSLRQLLTAPGSLVHIQWPEHVSRGPTPLATMAKHARAVAIVGALRFRGHRVVLTAHNREPHGESDRIDRWFRNQIVNLAHAVIVLVPDHERTLRHDGSIGPATRVVTIPHPTTKPPTPLPLGSGRRQLLVLGQIHPYHRIRGFIDLIASAAQPSPVLVAGGVGDDSLLAEIQELAEHTPWLEVRPGYVDDDELLAILAQTAAVVTLQRNPFNSGGPFHALGHGLPTIMSAGAQADDLISHLGDEWVFPMPADLSTVDVTELQDWLTKTRGEPQIEHFEIGAITEAHIELYELLRSG